MKKGNKGFTLIELLVVIAIIAILSTVVMAGLNSARQKGRDAKRLSDIKQLQTALELFFDTCGGYPNLAVATGLTTSTVSTTAGNCATSFGTFMNPMPVNPLPGGETYTYCGVATNAAPTQLTNPLTQTAGSCELAAGIGSASYRIGFNLEGQSGSLGAGDHIATPSGII